MLALWKRRHFMEPLRSDCRISRSDGIDVDRLCEEEMRAWYLNLLRTAPPRLLAPSNVARDCRATVSAHGVMEVILPEGVVRVLSVQLSGWEREAIVEQCMASPTVKLQSNPYGRGGAANPVAVHFPGSEVMRVYSPTIASGTPIIKVEAATDPGPERYVMDEEAIALIGPR